MMRKDIDWFEMWYQDKKDILSIMAKNMADDLEVGYDYYGNSIQTQIREMNEYKERFDEQLMALSDFDEKKTQRWCYLDLLRRGAITA